MQNMLNRYFTKIFCINLDRRTDRMDRFNTMAQKFGFTYTRWPAIDGLLLTHPNGMLMEENERRNMELACKLSHLRILKYAKEQGIEKILIFEDDAIIADDFEIIFLPAENDLSRHDWDMFYLGFNDINRSKEIVTAHLCRVWTGFTTHAYAVHSRSYDKLISALEYRGQADVLYADYIHPLGNSYSVNPNIVYQQDGYSDITQKEESYKSLR